MKVSVLIANYNNGLYLADCFASIRKQTYSNWEIVIIDDGSTDDSIKIIKTFACEDKRIVFCSNGSNRGCGFTKRRCVDISTGEICGFVDPDDTLAPNALQLMVQEHIKFSGHSVIYSTHFVCNEKLQNCVIEKSIGQIDEGYSQLTSKSKKISAFATFKRSCYNKTDGLNAKFRRAVDQDLYYKLEEVGPTHFINYPLYFYRIHKNGISFNCGAQEDHLQVIKLTYHRRKKLKIKDQYPYNITLSQLRKLFDEFYINKAEKNIQEKMYRTAIGILLSTSQYLSSSTVLQRAKMLLKSIYYFSVLKSEQ